ncbi:uncharacterized protein LOC112188566 [Rosa chinensis]|uniref:uncharacterized protein LOC112188566 n=1 Tax=Rosa chinensis TaxID=74649 RepID=UPI000D096812|nr:uncharacterized protein LOC112188566 [Rosa chinensis]
MAAEAPSSSSSRSNVYHQGSDDKALTESDLAAAQQLMQLSDEDNNNSSSSCGSKKRRSYKGEEYETDEEGVEYQSPLSVITCAKIEEIFGKEDEQDYQPKKKTKSYRSLADIYLTTKPIRT